MSMYGLVFGEHKGAEAVLALLDLSPADVGRFRDAWIELDGRGGVRAAVYTRNGGNNRDCWDGADSAECDCSGCAITHRLPQHPLYAGDSDDDFDNTYATVYFRLPEKPEVLEAIRAALPEPVNTGDRWREVLDALGGSQS